MIPQIQKLDLLQVQGQLNKSTIKNMVDNKSMLKKPLKRLPEILKRSVNRWDSRTQRRDVTSTLRTSLQPRLKLSSEKSSKNSEKLKALSFSPRKVTHSTPLYVTSPQIALPMVDNNSTCLLSTASSFMSTTMSSKNLERFNRKRLEIRPISKFFKDPNPNRSVLSFSTIPKWFRSFKCLLLS